MVLVRESLPTLQAHWDYAKIISPQRCEGFGPMPPGSAEEEFEILIQNLKQILRHRQNSEENSVVVFPRAQGVWPLEPLPHPTCQPQNLLTALCLGCSETHVLTSLPGKSMTHTCM